MSSDSGKIGFDITQKERGRIHSNYQGLRTLLEAEQFTCEEINEFPITLETLQQYRIIFFACPDSSKLRPEEIQALLRYVTLGGTLILLNHAGGDQGRRTNLGAITAQCGISFHNDEVLDPLSNLGLESYPLITEFDQHPILKDVTNICHRIGCTLNITDGAIALAFTADSADPPNKAVMGVASCGKGHVIATGSYEMFMDDVKGGIKYPNNAKIVKNLIKWLNPNQEIISQPMTQPDDTPLPEDIESVHTCSGENPNVATIITKIENLETKYKKLEKNLHNIKEESKNFLTDNTELREKIRIFELNLKDFPDQAMFELNVEIKSLNSKFKTQSDLISKLEQETSLLRDKLSRINQNLKTFTEPLQSPRSTDSPTTIPPLSITTAAEVINKKEKILNPRVLAELNAYLQILQILENQFNNGVLSKNQYREKRLKFEKRIAELQRHQ
ncbi:MAG: hypothetical protein HWN65_06265 [Candidatus Helarchaeota archaeon]|nr:hypothetical protein [Candidatus Helarchaeota archaeon]